jgi:hypothetical protein
MMKYKAMFLTSLLCLTSTVNAKEMTLFEKTAGQPQKGAVVSTDNLALKVAQQRAFEAVIWAMPATAIHRLREGFMDVPGVDNNVIVAYSTPAISKHKAITSNAATPYITAYTDLRDGPVVLNLPAVSEKASLYGQVVDAWQSTIADVGPAGLDKGKGGKYLFLPPNYQGDVPQGYFVVQSTTNRISLVFRSVRSVKGTDKDAYQYTQTMEMYYLKDEAKTDKTKFVDGSAYPLYTLPRYDISALEDIHNIINVEPAKRRDMVMYGMLKTIGIEAGKPFAPKKAMKAALEQGVVDAYHYMHELAYKQHERNMYWLNRNWSFVMEADTKGGFDYETNNSIDIDERAGAWNFFTLYPKKLAEKPATVYLAPIKDSKDRLLAKDKNYRVNVPANIPAGQFWSVTVYDDATWAFISNPLQRSGLGSFNKENLAVNKNGSVDIYFGPDAPKGKESNWLPTQGKKPYVWLRLYGPQQAFWDKSFVMPNVEMIED